jgi:mannosyltransferase OCH1-like enzyme
MASSHVVSPASGPGCGSSSGEDSAFVKALHFSFGFFDSSMPARIADHIAAVSATNPDFTVKVWGPQESRALIADMFPQHLAKYDALQWPIQRSDMSRYAILYAHGGLYADLDYMFKAPLAKVLSAALPPPTDAFVNETPNATALRRRASNSLMGARSPGHPFWLVVLDTINQGTGLSKHARVLSSTGPQAVDRALATWRREVRRRGVTDTVALAPKAVFNPCSICDRNALSTADKPGVLAVHAAGGSWNTPLSRCYNTLACEWPWAVALVVVLALAVVATVFAVKGAAPKK